MAKLQLLNVFLTERLIIAAKEIFKVVEETLLEYEEEITRTKKENIHLKSRLRDALRNRGVEACSAEKPLEEELGPGAPKQDQESRSHDDDDDDDYVELTSSQSTQIKMETFQITSVVSEAQLALVNAHAAQAHDECFSGARGMDRDESVSSKLLDHQTKRELSGRDKAARYRQRINADPTRRTEYLLKRKESYQRRKVEGKLKYACHLSASEKRAQRERWRISQRKHRDRGRRRVGTMLMLSTRSLENMPLNT